VSLFLALLVCPIGGWSQEAPAQTGDGVRAGCEVDYPPFCTVDEQGSARGFSVELLRVAIKAMERDVTFRTGPWAEVKGWLARGEIDALPLVGRTLEREALFDFTVPYMTMRGCIVVRQGSRDIHNLGDLRGRRVVVMDADNAEEFLLREQRNFDIISVPTFADALRMLCEGGGRCGFHAAFGCASFDR